MPQAPATIWATKSAIGKVVSRLLPLPCPEVVAGDGSLSNIGAILQRMGGKKPLIVTDEILVKIGTVDLCTSALKAAGLSWEIFDGVTANPPVDQVEKGYDLYKKSGCDSIIALGGGSPMDCAKVIGAKVTNPKDIRSMEGMFQVTWMLYKLPPLIAIPTTAGTGSETTVAAVITLPEEKRKISIMDTGLVPQVAILDPQVLKKCPVPVLAATGMDALTHAVESYLNRWSTEFSRKHSLMAVEKIFRNLLPACNVGTPTEEKVLASRGTMLQASFEAGVAFTRAHVGYVHAIAHQLGGLYHTPHGNANAMLLAPVLNFYLRDELEASNDSTPMTSCPVASELFNLAQAAGHASHYQEYPPKEQREFARQFVETIRHMVDVLKMPKEVPSMKASDVRDVAQRALTEAHGNFHNVVSLKYILDLGMPVPKYMTPAECEDVVAQVLTSTERVAWEALRASGGAGTQPLLQAKL